MSKSARKYFSESPFWYFLAHRVSNESGDSIDPILASLNDRAQTLQLPLRFPQGHATAWAILCRLFVTCRPLWPQLGRFSFTQMRLGFARVIQPKGIVDTGFERIVKNIKEPAFVGRTPLESVGDTFLANGSELMAKELTPTSWDGPMMAALLSDERSCALAQRAVEPPSDLIEKTIEEYGRRRPGFFRRQFSHPAGWLFD